MARKRVVLFIVEGITDQESLELLLEEFIQDNNQVIFEVVDGDITSRTKSGAPYIPNLLILEVSHIMPTSGSTIVLLSQSSCTSTGAEKTMHAPFFWLMKA